MKFIRMIVPLALALAALAKGSAIPGIPHLPLSTAMDEALKFAHLREESGVEKARETLHGAMHNLQLALSMQESSLVEKALAAIKDASASLLSAAPHFHEPSASEKAWAALDHALSSVHSSFTAKDASTVERAMASLREATSSLFPSPPARIIHRVLEALHEAQDAAEKNPAMPAHYFAEARSALLDSTHALLKTLGVGHESVDRGGWRVVNKMNRAVLPLLLGQKPLVR
jgi:hypothetical protein